MFEVTFTECIHLCTVLCTFFNCAAFSLQHIKLRATIFPLINYYSKLL